MTEHENDGQGSADAESCVVVAHSSDLHLGDEETTALNGGDTTAPLARVLAVARAARADALVLAGDVFENNRVPAAVVTRAGALLAEAGLPVIVLPGNHDPLTPGAVWRADTLTAGTGIEVLGVTCGRLARLPGLDLAVWGNPHLDYDDMVPLRAPRRRITRFHVAVAHGHYEAAPDRRVRPRPAWLIGDADIAGSGSDYVALGHWNNPVPVGAGDVPAHYSGSPDYAHSINIVTLTGGGARVRRQPLPATEPADA